MSSQTFGIGIPTVNRYDLLVSSLGLYAADFPSTQVVVLDNGNQGIAAHHNMTILNYGRNLGVAASWNLLCKKIFEKCDHAIILNDDIYLGKNQDQIDGYLTEQQHGFHVSEKQWCIFIINKETFEKVGDFDEGFEIAYFEDSDYSWRMVQAQIDIYRTSYLDPEIFRVSQSVQKDRFLNRNFMSNQQRFIDKWGGLPGKEIYVKAFNQ